MVEVDSEPVSGTLQKAGESPPNGKLVFHTSLRLGSLLDRGTLYAEPQNHPSKGQLRNPEQCVFHGDFMGLICADENNFTVQTDL